jgi:AraC family transcriptional regulator
MGAVTRFEPVPVARALSLTSVSAPGLRWVCAAHAEGVVGMHAHEETTLTLVARGAYEERRDRSAAQTFAIGSAWLRPAGASHANRFPSEGIESLVIEVAPERAAQIGEYWKGVGGIARFDSPEIARLTRTLRREMQARDTAAPLALEAGTLELFAAVARLDHGKTPPAWLRRVREALADDAATAWDVRALARHAGVHPVHLARAFREHYGASPGEWLRERRLEQARERLLADSAPLSEIALAAGFSDQSHFTRAFRARFGIPPGRFRRGG